ncbi:phospholipase A2 [Kryptolebias marmoratus]|uniref:Phospholipase A2 n=1 Tax=Kryptolebias marmoratus TaxID=37003 RepID=A0A3Q3AEY4_KRYMA|nr:phospholipase A2 [Kryptolebias marmoratus]
MNGPAVLLLLTACAVGEELVDRAFWQFGNMISCAQPNVNPLAYNDYGCFCGFGGTGTPVDEVDKCCQTHDNCYGNSRKTEGCTSIFNNPILRIYKYSCSDKEVTCSDANDKCQAAVCECDRAAAHCFAQNDYNSENKNLDFKVRCVDKGSR